MPTSKTRTRNDIPVYEEFRNFDDSNHLDTVPEKMVSWFSIRGTGYFYKALVTLLTRIHV